MGKQRYRVKRELSMTKAGSREGWTMPVGSVSIDSYSIADGSQWLEFDGGTHLPLSYVVENADFFEVEELTVDKPKLDEIVEKIKAGIPPTDEEVQVVREAFAEIGAIFETMRVHVAAAAEVFANVWQSYMASLPPSFVDEIERRVKEKEDADRC